MSLWKHLLHPGRTSRVVAARVLARVSMRRFAAHSKKHFRGNPIYNLNSVTEGFASRPDNASDETELLERICKAYSLAISDSHSAHAHYQETEWWKELQAGPLASVMRALESGDVAALRPMYANFFRDRCANGLVGIPYGMARAYFQGPMLDVHRHCYMGDALYRLNYWREQTGGRFSVPDLAGPAVGNPFGVSIDGTLVPSGSEYQHYCAHKILGLLNNGQHVVGEIGGGYGGVAYYLLRDGAHVNYIDFDVPGSIALTSYYLMKAFPASRFLLYGNQELVPEAVAASEIALLPLFEMARMPGRYFDLTFSSHVMGDLSDGAMAEFKHHRTHDQKSLCLFRRYRRLGANHERARWTRRARGGAGHGLESSQNDEAGRRRVRLPNQPQ